jgi:hypothetical protein
VFRVDGVEVREGEVGRHDEGDAVEELQHADDDLGADLESPDDAEDAGAREGGRTRGRASPSFLIKCT